MYESLGGVSADTDWFKCMEEARDLDSSAAPKKKHCNNKGKERISREGDKVDAGIEERKIDIVINKLEDIENKISV